MELNLTWITCETPPVWCPLEIVKLGNVVSEGVYIIWHGGQNPSTVRVGSGIIAQRLASHRSDARILTYRERGTLYVTWADVPAQYQEGVENYLADRLQPLVGERFPNVAPIVVNLPW